MTDAQQLLDFANEVAQEAARTAREATVTPDTAENKAGAADWVTPVDREVELLVRRRIADAFPKHQVVGEEFGAESELADGSDRDDDQDRVVWHIDPIDGTTNFLYGLSNPTVSLAAIRGRRLMVGVVTDIFRNESISAATGLGVQVDRQPAPLRTASGLAGEVVLTEWSKNHPWPGMYPFLDWAVRQEATVRIPGSCALDLAVAGLGRAAVTILAGGYNSWDVAAGLAIAREAGLAVYDLRGRTDDPVPAGGLLVAPPILAESAWHAWMSARA